MMRIAISNLAWPAEREGRIFAYLAERGVAGVEIAPTRIGGWDELTPAMLLDFRTQLGDAGLVASSLQAILFGRNDVHLLQDAAAFERLADHLARVAAMAADLGAGVLVFGAPRNRRRGRLGESQAWNLARERFARLGRIAADSGVILGIEPVPTHYGGDFLGSWQDVLAMVRDVESPGVRVHLDTACVHLGGGSIAEAITTAGPLLAHFHAAQSDLGDFAAPLPNHTTAAAALRVAGYDGWVAIEMREQAPDPIDAIAAAVAAVTAIYNG